MLRFGAFVRRASVTSVICFLAEFGSTDAGALTGTELYRACRQKALSAGGISCIAYVRGFVDEITLGHGLGKTSPTVYCLSAAGARRGSSAPNHSEVPQTSPGEFTFGSWKFGGQRINGSISLSFKIKLAGCSEYPISGLQKQGGIESST